MSTTIIQRHIDSGNHYLEIGNLPLANFDAGVAQGLAQARPRSGSAEQGDALEALIRRLALANKKAAETVALVIPALVKIEEVEVDGAKYMVRRPDGGPGVGYSYVPCPTQAEIDAVLRWCAAHSHVPDFNAKVDGFSMHVV